MGRVWGFARSVAVNVLDILMYNSNYRLFSYCIDYRDLTG